MVKSFSTSRSSSEEVGSSRISTLQSISTARAIAIICCNASEYSFKITCYINVKLQLLHQSCCLTVHGLFRLTVPSFVSGSRPYVKILCDRKIRTEVDFLIYRRNTFFLGIHSIFVYDRMIEPFEVESLRPQIYLRRSDI